MSTSKSRKRIILIKAKLVVLVQSQDCHDSSCMMDTRSLTFPQEWRFVVVHVLLWDQAEVGHFVGLHALEGAMLCNLLNSFLTQFGAQEL